MSGTQTDIVVRKSTDLSQIAELERILLTDEEVEVVDDPDLMSKEIVAQLLSAESDEELENFGNAQGWRELEGVPMLVHGFRWRPSDMEGGASIYFVVDATQLDTGERVVLTTGSRNVLAQLTNLAKRGRIPGAVRQITKAQKATRAGFFPLMLTTPEGEHGGFISTAESGNGDAAAGE